MAANVAHAHRDYMAHKDELLDSIDGAFVRRVRAADTQREGPPMRGRLAGGVGLPSVATRMLGTLRSRATVRAAHLGVEAAG